MAGTRGSETKVSERASLFLKTLIEHHIRDGQPVGSRTLAKETGLDLSPATVRNVMSDLEDMGLVSSPHTSAGRIPTLLGYRLFVDSLLTIKPLDEIDVNALRAEFEPLDEAAALVDTASRLLSGVTRLAGVVMLPRHERDVFRQIELLPLSGKKVLAILITGEGEVHNRILHTERTFSPAQLVQASNFLTELFTGQDMVDVRKRLVEDLHATHRQMDAMLRQALEMAQRVMESAEHKEQLLVSGQTNLMQFDELANADRLKTLFDAFNEKREILYLLDRCIQADGVQIFFGGESGYEVLDDCSLVTTPYRVDGEVLGVLGVIGPTRMDYQRVIPVVDVTARLLAAALRQHN
ncbi:Heat-inducible transcription repressor HrcA [Thiorhodovibrio winogradskyi]|uniref:Heat-inducible transcription repressor HrcA n=1 Tax=Thiorhodovibrio winogradskyi TaxID=77007 RepID=A0ABZ0S9E3_9GAMM|nr:heat-inducible transcriptional repressor HrcA [Thiorhodovibrio winogradskyi]